MFRPRAGPRVLTVYKLAGSQELRCQFCSEMSNISVAGDGWLRPPEARALLGVGDQSQFLPLTLDSVWLRLFRFLLQT